MIAEQATPRRLTKEPRHARAFQIVPASHIELACERVFDVREAEHDRSQELAIGKAVPHLLEQELRHQNARERQVLRMWEHRGEPCQAGDSVRATDRLRSLKTTPQQTNREVNYYMEFFNYD